MTVRTGVKMCGLRTTEDVVHAVAAGADAVGFILAPGMRHVRPDAVRDMIRRIHAAGRGRPATVGVVAGLGSEDVHHALIVSGVDFAQLSGGLEESERLLADGAVPAGIGTIVVIHVRPEDTATTLASQVDQWQARCDRILFDTWSGTAAGGTGRHFRHGMLARLAETPDRGIAGGLTPSNVAGAIRACAPGFVDVSSGIERTPGTKDPLLMSAFTSEVHG